MNAVPRKSSQFLMRNILCSEEVEKSLTSPSGPEAALSQSDRSRLQHSRHLEGLQEKEELSNPSQKSGNLRTISIFSVKSAYHFVT